VKPTSDVAVRDLSGEEGRVCLLGCQLSIVVLEYLVAETTMTITV
jgi:hypothetical protein